MDDEKWGLFIQVIATQGKVRKMEQNPNLILTCLRF